VAWVHMAVRFKDRGRPPERVMADGNGLPVGDGDDWLFRYTSNAGAVEVRRFSKAEVLTWDRVPP